MSVRGNWDRRGGDPIGRLGSIDRRRFLRLSGAGAAALVAGAGPYTERALAASALTSYPFRLGVASGDPRPTEVVLWTRLAPRPHDEDGRGGMPARKVDVRWEVAHDEAFRQVVARGRAPAYPELGHSVHVEVGGLRSARRYFYRFKAGADTSPVGRTSTVPQLGRAVRELTFAFASCQQFEHGYYTAYRHMAREDLDLVVHLGDYIYEYGPNRYNAPGGNVRRHNSREPTKLAGYRRRHALYRDDSNLKAAHAAFPWVVTWDDHEVENNYADDIAQHGGRGSTSCAVGPPPTRPTTSTCRCGASRLPPGPTCDSFAPSPTVILRTSGCSTPASIETTRRAGTARSRRVRSPVPLAGP